MTNDIPISPAPTSPDAVNPPAAPPPTEEASLAATGDASPAATAEVPTEPAAQPAETPPSEPPAVATAAQPPEPQSNKHWYVVKVQSGREESIKEAIERRVKIEGLEEFYGQIVIPMEK